MQSYDGLLDIAKYQALKNLSPRTVTSMIINNFQNFNLSLGIGVYAAVPETGCDVGKTVIGFGGSVVGDFVKTLVGSRGIQRTEMLDIRPDLDIVEGHVKSLLNVAAARIKRPIKHLFFSSSARAMYSAWYLSRSKSSIS